MNAPSFRSRSPNKFACVVAALTWLALVLAASREARAQTPPADQSAAETATTDTATEQETKVPEAELDSLVAPIALYPDPLLSQTLVASTYPVELMQLQQWMGKNTSLKDQALADAVAKQPWDASIQGLATFPDVVEMLAGNIQWTSDLGNAFLAQQPDVMAAVQRMRAKAQGTGTLKTTEQQKVETQTTDAGQQAIVIEPADPSVVYVPSYDPAVVYGAPAYPYPTVTYPGYVAGRGLAFGAGLALGTAWNGGWGYNCGWNNGDVNVNYNNTYVKNSNKNVNQSNKNWQHNPQHRGNAPYGNKQTANKYGGTAKGQGGPALELAQAAALRLKVPERVPAQHRRADKGLVPVAEQPERLVAAQPEHGTAALVAKRVVAAAPKPSRPRSRAEAEQLQNLRARQDQASVEASLEAGWRWCQ